MKILLVIGILIPFIFFGYLMSLLDNFLVLNMASISEKDNSFNAIVLGSSDLAIKTIALLESKGFKVIWLMDPYQLIAEKNINYLFALSDNDADNIAFYKIGMKLYCIENRLSICNDNKNETLFVSEKIKYIKSEKASAIDLLQMVYSSRG